MFRIIYVKEYYGKKFVEYFGASAITIGNRIFYSHKDYSSVPERIRIHEMVHVRQYGELGILGFLFKYAYEYIHGRLIGLSHWESYYNISLEKEAFMIQEGV